MLAPDDLINDALDNIMHLSISVECDNFVLPRRHSKSRFPFFKHSTLRDEFRTDAFYPSTRSAQNHTCAQMLICKDTGY